MNFIDTVTINAKVRVFRFEHDTSKSSYLISSLDNQRLPAFSMEKVDGQWKIVGTVSDEIKDAEKLLHDIIQENLTSQYS